MTQLSRTKKLPTFRRKTGLALCMAGGQDWRAAEIGNTRGQHLEHVLRTRTRGTLRAHTPGARSGHTLRARARGTYSRSAFRRRNGPSSQDSDFDENASNHRYLLWRSSPERSGRAPANLRQNVCLKCMPKVHFSSAPRCVPRVRFPSDCSECVPQVFACLEWCVCV